MITNFKKISWDMASKTIIIVFFFVFMLLATLTLTTPSGESDDYMLTTIALENRFSLRLTEDDVEQAKTDFPEHYAYIKDSWDKGMPRYFSIVEGEVYPWYMGTYSLTCIPVKQLLKALGLSQSYAFAITNVFWYVIALLAVYFKLLTDRKNVFFTILLLVCSPTVLYYFWPSAEIFIFSMVVISLVYFCNGNHKLAGLYISIAGTLNPTVMAYGAVIILDYLIKLYFESKKEGEKNIIKIILNNIKDIMILGVCFLPSLITFIYNYINFKVFNLQNVLGLARTDLWFQRFLTYIFDLNLGFLPYFSIVMVIFFIVGIIGIFKRDRMSIMLVLAFFLTVAAYAVTWHINCGMTGISRYNAWSFPIFILFLTTQATRLINRNNVKRILYSLFLCSSILTTLVVIYVRKSETGMSSMHFSPIAIKVLDNYPVLYNPYSYTFIARVKHVDGGYWEKCTEPVIYTDSDGYIRKILLMPNSSDTLINSVRGSDSDLKKLEAKFSSTKSNYINLEKEIKLKLAINAPEKFNAIENQNITEFTSGVCGNEVSFNWISPNAMLILKTNKITQEGLTLKFNSPLKLKPLNEKPLRMDIYINDVLIESIPINEIKSYNIHIDESKIIESVDGYYEIKLITNGVYNPYKEGISQDNRDLSIQLEYVG